MQGLTLLPWRSGRLTVTSAGDVAKAAEETKCDEYRGLDSNLYIFVPISIETFGVVSPRAAVFLKEPGSHRIQSRVGRMKMLGSSDPPGPPIDLMCPKEYQKWYPLTLSLIRIFLRHVY
ncbi:hypothetical protein GJ496_000904 [Pomphorhynchus laevis]|nr:hypothetical protein GJ496_000904 [Pomphorhynchus laevis]